MNTYRICAFLHHLDNDVRALIQQNSAKGRRVPRPKMVSFEALFGLPIDEEIENGFSAFTDMVDAAAEKES